MLPQFRDFVSRIKIRSFVAIGCALLLSAALTPVAHAQALYGSIVGIVTDQSGAVVPGVQVTAKNAGTGQTKDDTTDASGRFNLQNLLPGDYSLSMKGTGFKTVERSGISITPNTIERVNQALELGQATEQVTVSAETVTLQTDKADTHTEITSASPW